MTTIDLQEKANDMAGNWEKFNSFCWFEQPDNPKEWAIVYTSNRDSGSLGRANAIVIAKAMDPYLETDDALAQRHNHWAVGHVDGYAIRVFRDGAVTDAFCKWMELQERLDDYPVLDEDVWSEVQQEEINDSWKAWVKHDFTRCLEERFGREVRDDADMEELFHQQEPEWNEDSSGMYCDIKRVIEKIELKDVESFFVQL